MINPKGTLLTLSAQEAVKECDGKPLLAQGIASNLNDLCEKAGLRVKDIVRIQPSGFERIAQWITILAPIFLLGGMIGAYLEFKSPGFGVAGILSAICFLLFLPGTILRDSPVSEVVAVFVLGMLLGAYRASLLSGSDVAGIARDGADDGRPAFAMVDFYPNQPFDFSLDVLVRPLLNLGIAVVLFVFAVSALARFLPDLRSSTGSFLRHKVPQDLPWKRAAARVFEAPRQGGRGEVARTILRPAGKAEFGAALVDVVTDGSSPRSRREGAGRDGGRRSCCSRASQRG